MIENAIGIWIVYGAMTVLMCVIARVDGMPRSKSDALGFMLGLIMWVWFTALIVKFII